MHKGIPQVTKNASKVRKSGTRWAHFGTSELTFEAGWAIFGLPWRITFKHLLCGFVQYSSFSVQFAVFFCVFHKFSWKMHKCSRKPYKNA